MRKAILIILDGFGESSETHYNAVYTAETPNIDRIFSRNPQSTLKCSGSDVGLPAGLMGNSEVGHLNIGAGRIIKQMLVKIDDAIEDGSFFKNEALLEIMERVRATHTKLHLFGLASEGGVHSSLNHLYALLRMAKSNGLEDVFIHAFTDGRDTSPDSGINFMKEILMNADEIGTGKVASVAGRYYAMDRDRRWDRVERAYRALVHGEGEKFSNPVEAIQASYDNGVTDEFIPPSVIFEDGKPVGTIRDGDGIIAFNFRADRMRQITLAFTADDFKGFGGERPDVSYTTMTNYDDEYILPVAFKSERYANILASVVSQAGLRQLRIAETEKYAHVTYFFNGGEEMPFPGEKRIMVDSPKVATYDLQPEMSAVKVTFTVLSEIEADSHDLIVLNYANCDMVGHTGRFEAAVRAVEAVDEQVGRVVRAMTARSGVCLITADHGNAEIMWDIENNGPHTVHSTNPVPIVLVGLEEGVGLREGGRLSDIAPTLLEILELEKPDEMTGISLLDRGKQPIEIQNKETVLNEV